MDLLALLAGIVDKSRIFTEFFFSTTRLVSQSAGYDGMGCSLKTTKRDTYAI